MAGNSQRRGAVRKAGTKKGPTVGSGGVRRRGLEGRGATPPAHMRPNHPGRQTRGQGPAAAAAASTQDRRHRDRAGPQPGAGVPARRGARHRAVRGARHRGRRAAHRIRHAGSRFRHLDPRGAAHDLDRISTNGLHQGIALQVPPYDYAHPDDLLRSRDERQRRPRCWSRWTTSPTRATSVRSCGRWRRSAATAC